ncbi:MAG TPA: response regulator, partial [Xanthomonadales bacterium]|nr:response regulator [Xanthomonadales bacterium]
PAPRIRVLVIDNEPAVLRGMQALLAGWSCDVEVAADPESALAAARRARPDLVVVDFHLDHGATGLAVLERLAEAVGPVPAIVVTADHSEAVRDAVRAAGAQLLLKPLRPLALKSLMARLVAARTRAAS